MKMADSLDTSSGNEKEASDTLNESIKPLNMGLEISTSYNSNKKAYDDVVPCSSVPSSYKSKEEEELEKNGSDSNSNEYITDHIVTNLWPEKPDEFVSSQADSHGMENCCSSDVHSIDETSSCRDPSQNMVQAVPAHVDYHQIEAIAEISSLQAEGGSQNFPNNSATSSDVFNCEPEVRDTAQNSNIPIEFSPESPESHALNQNSSPSESSEDLQEVKRQITEGLDDTDSEIEVAAANFTDVLSDMAELSLEECNIDACSINSHNLVELEMIQGLKSNVNIDLESNSINPSNVNCEQISEGIKDRSEIFAYLPSCDPPGATVTLVHSETPLYENIIPLEEKEQISPIKSTPTTCDNSNKRVTFVDPGPIIEDLGSQGQTVSQAEVYDQVCVPPKPCIIASLMDQAPQDAPEKHLYDVPLTSEMSSEGPPTPTGVYLLLQKANENTAAQNEANEPQDGERLYETIDETRPQKSVQDSHSSRSSRSSRSSTMSGPCSDEKLYEDVTDLDLLCDSSSTQQHLQEGDAAPWFSKRLQNHKQLSSSDSWGSEDFDSCSSNEEEEKPSQPNNEPENFKQRLMKRREKWREKRQSSRNLKFSLRKDSREEKENISKELELENDNQNQTESRFHRWFSMRKNYSIERKAGNALPNDRCSSYTLNNGTPPAAFLNSHPLQQHRMPRLLEEADQDGVAGMFTDNIFDSPFHRRHHPPTLPPMPPGLSPEQIKRRHIITSIVHSENNYVATLHRLVNEYKKPLEESKPPILNSQKIETLFYCLPQILQCHTLFRIALSECVRQWDKDERIGDVFVASFSKSIVFNVYSDFINNFSRAMELAKQESKKKSAFADFLKMRQITSNDRLSFFGLMVKPVQRFPQFILFLQDLLKHTPQGHHDRMSLQLALTQLESLAEMLNERKREAEQYQAFRDTLKHINTKFALRGLADGNRYLLRQDNITQLEFNQSGMINKTKDRRLFLTNDLVICVSVVPKSGDDFLQQSERLSLKWAYPVSDVEIADNSSSPTLSRLLAAGLHKSGSMNSSRIPEESLGANNVDNLVQEMNDLMHDYEVVSRISKLVSSLKSNYEGLNQGLVHMVSSSIQRAIHQKDEQMAWIDACCLQFSIKTKDGREKETFTFQTDNPIVKKDWIVELRLAQLAMDRNNSPAWDLPDTEKRPSTKMPLFVKSLPVFSSKHQTEVKCGCCYTVIPNRPTRTTRQQTYIWLCSSDGMSSHLTIFQMQQVGLREIVKIDLTEICVNALQHVPALGTLIDKNCEECPLKSHTVWMGTDSHRLLVYSGLDPEKQNELSSTSVPSAITTIKYHFDQVFVGLTNGTVQVYRRGIDGAWLLSEPITITLAVDPVMALLPISTHVYASSGNKVHVIDCFTAQVMKEYEIQHENSGAVQLMAHSGIGLWIAQEQSSTICLYHTETFRHLQDINVASNVSRMLSETGHTSTPTKIYVTALVASKGLLWVGTNVGVALTIPLPRLEGVPIISGRANISFHAHLGPITFLMALQTQSGRTSITAPPPDPRFTPQDNASETHEPHIDGRSSTVPPNPSVRLEKQQSDGSLMPKKSVPRLRQQLSSPIMPRRRQRESRDQTRRVSKTLPRGLGAFSLSGSQECDVYGVCGALLNVQNYDDDTLGNECGSLALSRYDSMRRSDPEIAIPEQLSTLDRRVRLKASRPRSLDLSTWSVDSRASSACTTVSSGSDEVVLGGGCSNTTRAHSPILNRHHPNGTINKATTLVKRKEIDLPRTLMVVTGGRGYINWQRSESPTMPNMKDAHIIVWEMKL